MPEELCTSRDFCELAEKFEELKRENEELVSDKTYLINAAMDGGDKYHYTAHDIAYRDLERKCKALEAEYAISNRELLIKQVEINRQSARIAELEAAQHWIPVEERLPEDWTMVLFTNGVIRGIGQFDKEGFYDYWCEHSFDKPVTHWMPLPNLPEVNNE